MATGTRTTYVDTVIQKRSLQPVIHNIDWKEAPLLNMFGVNGESKFRLLNWPRTKYEWLEDSMPPRSTTLAEALDDSETAVDVAAGTGQYFKQGDVLKVTGSAERMIVQSVATDTLTVTRGALGTTATTHDNGAAVDMSTIARNEAADFTTGYTTVTSSLYNHTQIFAEAIKVSGSEQVDAKYGVSDTMAYHLAKLIGGPSGGDVMGGSPPGTAAMGQRFRAGKLPILLESTFFNGVRHAGSASTPRSMGGFDTFVTTNVTNKSGAEIEYDDIVDLVEDCYLAGGMPDTIITNTTARRKLTNLFEGYVYTERTEKYGGMRIDYIEMPFGGVNALEVITARWCPQDVMYVVERDKMGWVTHRPFALYDREPAGDYEISEVIGEYGFVLLHEKAHGKIHNFATTFG